MSSEIKADSIQSTGSRVLASDSGSAWSWGSGVPTGTMHNCVSMQKRDAVSSGAISGVPVDISGMTLDITPTSTTSKVLILVSLNIGAQADSYPAFVIVRDSTTLPINTTVGTGTEVMFSGATVSSHSSANEQINFHYLDSPNKNTSTTYKIQWRAMSTTTRTIKLNQAHTLADDNQTLGTSTLTLIEVTS